jgi:hypothetical protein
VAARLRREGGVEEAARLVEQAVSNGHR